MPSAMPNRSRRSSTAPYLGRGPGRAAASKPRNGLVESVKKPSWGGWLRPQHGPQSHQDRRAATASNPTGGLHGPLEECRKLRAPGLRHHDRTCTCSGPAGSPPPPGAGWRRRFRGPFGLTNFRRRRDAPGRRSSRRARACGVTVMPDAELPAPCRAPPCVATHPGRPRDRYA